MLACVKFWLALVLWFLVIVNAQTYPLLPPLSLDLVVQGLQDPLYVTTPPNDERLFVVNRSGTVMIVQDGQVLKEPFLDVSRQTATIGEMGLLSLAFHPDYAENGRVFVLFARLNPFDTVVAEFRRDPQNVNRTHPHMQVIFSIPQQPESTIHRGGHLEFGPDGKLYVSTGDSGLNLGQDQSWNGKVFRLDVDLSWMISRGSHYPERLVQAEPYAKGLRNAWRFSFDTQTGDMYLGDVGSSLYEEVNLIHEGGNYGWPYMEGNACRDVQYSLLCNTGIFEKPIYSYAHLDRDARGGSAVMGGYVYHGEIKSLQGTYIFADMLGNIWGLRKENRVWRRHALAQPWGGIVSLGKDTKGELYVVNITNGSLYKLMLKSTDFELSNLLTEKPETIALDGFSELVQGTRWMYGPESSLRLYVEDQTDLQLHLVGEHPFTGQTLQIIHNGEVVLDKVLLKAFDIHLPLLMQKGINEVRFTVSQWDKDPAAPYALKITAFSWEDQPRASKD